MPPVFSEHASHISLSSLSSDVSDISEADSENESSQDSGLSFSAISSEVEIVGDGPSKDKDVQIVYAPPRDKKQKQQRVDQYFQTKTQLEVRREKERAPSIDQDVIDEKIRARKSREADLADLQQPRRGPGRPRKVLEVTYDRTTRLRATDGPVPGVVKRKNMDWFANPAADLIIAQPFSQQSRLVVFYFDIPDSTWSCL